MIRSALLPPLRLAPSTSAAVSFTSLLGSITHLYPSSASAATFMPIELSPGLDVYTGTPHVCAALSNDLLLSPSTFSRAATYLPHSQWNSALDIAFWNSGARM